MDGIRYSVVTDTDTAPAIDSKLKAENIIRLTNILLDGVKNDAEYASLTRVKENAEKIVGKYDTLAQLKTELKDNTTTVSRHNTETKKKTLREVQKLKKRLENPTRSRNVVNGMQEFASSVLSVANAVFRGAVNASIAEITIERLSENTIYMKANFQETNFRLFFYLSSF